jgi:hypothetical protein
MAQQGAADALDHAHQAASDVLDRAHDTVNSIMGRVVGKGGHSKKRTIARILSEADKRHTKRGGKKGGSAFIPGGSAFLPQTGRGMVPL